MVNKNYLIGYRFERRVKKHFEKQEFDCIRQGRSKFPDLWVLSPKEKPFCVECKVNGRLSKDEKNKAKELMKRGYKFFVAYRDGKKLCFKDGVLIK